MFTLKEKADRSWLVFTVTGLIIMILVIISLASHDWVYIYIDNVNLKVGLWPACTADECGSLPQGKRRVNEKKLLK